MKKTVFRVGDNPGHGYPEHYDKKTVYVAFLDRADWERQVGQLTNSNDKKFTAIAVNPVRINRNVVVMVIE